MTSAPLTRDHVSPVRAQTREMLLAVQKEVAEKRIELPQFVLEAHVDEVNGLLSTHPALNELRFKLVPNRCVRGAAARPLKLRGQDEGDRLLALLVPAAVPPQNGAGRGAAPGAR